MKYLLLFTLLLAACGDTVEEPVVEPETPLCDADRQDYWYCDGPPNLVHCIDGEAKRYDCYGLSQPYTTKDNSGAEGFCWDYDCNYGAPQ